MCVCLINFFIVLYNCAVSVHACINLLIKKLFCFVSDLTAVCILEGFSNPNWMEQADRVLKDVGKEKAKEYYEASKILSKETLGHGSTSSFISITILLLI